MPSNNKIVLTSINTKPERTYIEIDGKDYGCRTATEMELRHMSALQRMQNKFANGFDSESDPEGDEVLSQMLDQMVRIILLDAPESVHKALKDMHRMAIVQAFTEAVSSKGPQTSSTESPTEMTDESPASSASTEAIPVTG